VNAVSDIAAELSVLRAYPPIDSIQIIVQSRLIIKARVYITPDLFLQIYRNDRFQTTNFALILGQQRIFGRDERDGQWHRHPSSNPNLHDDSTEGRKPTTLHDFWLETVRIINELGFLI